MNLWNLKIEEIPCGWEQTYQYALSDCPNGKNVEFKYMDHCDEMHIERYFYDPVKCHDLIIEEFNALKNKAENLIANRDKLDLSSFISRIVNIDVHLYHLLNDWITPEEDMDCSCYNPEIFSKNHDYAFYVDESFANTKFYHLRLLNRPNE